MAYQHADRPSHPSDGSFLRTRWLSRPQSMAHNAAIPCPTDFESHDGRYMSLSGTEHGIWW